MTLQEILTNLPSLSQEDLSSLITECQSEQARRSGEPCRVAVEFGSYNGRRYGRPWIARVTSWPVGGRPEIEFGTYVGSDRGGVAEILARPGDIVRTGQKDHRGRGTTAEWAVVEADCSIRYIEPTEARELFRG